MPSTSPSTSRSSRRCAASATACGRPRRPRRDEAVIRLLSLRVRLSLAFAVGAAVLVAIGVGRRVERAHPLGRRRHRQRAALAPGRRQRRRRVVRADAVVHADQFAQVIAADGSVLVDSSFGARGPVLAGAELAASLAGPRQVDRAVDGLGAARPPRLPTRCQRRAAPRWSSSAVTPGRCRAPVRAARLVMYLAPPIAALALGAAAWVLVGAALRPVTQLADEAARLSIGRLGRRLPVPAGDHEVAALATSLNSLLAAVEAAMATERQFLDDASHELRTPLTVVRGEVELAQLALAAGGHGRRRGGPPVRRCRRAGGRAADGAGRGPARAGPPRPGRAAPTAPRREPPAPGRGGRRPRRHRAARSPRWPATTCW